MSICCIEMAESHASADDKGQNFTSHRLHPTEFSCRRTVHCCWIYLLQIELITKHDHDDPLAPCIVHGKGPVNQAAMLMSRTVELKIRSDPDLCIYFPKITVHAVALRWSI